MTGINNIASKMAEQVFDASDGYTIAFICAGFYEEVSESFIQLHDCGLQVQEMLDLRDQLQAVGIAVERNIRGMDNP